jgi:hypothetical protein
MRKGRRGTRMKMFEAKRTAKERSILDEALVRIAQKLGNISVANMMIQKLIFSLIVCGWMSGFGKN